jgi:hypothetical protein
MGLPSGRSPTKIAGSDSLVTGTDLRIRILTKMSRILNTAFSWLSQRNLPLHPTSCLSLCAGSAVAGRGWTDRQRAGGLPHPSGNQSQQNRRKITLIEGNAKCRHLRKFTFAAGVNLSEAQNRIPPPPPYTLYTFIQYTYLFTQESEPKICLFKA